MLLTAADVTDYHNLFNSAEHEISILTGKSDMKYADDFITAACNFSRQPGSKLTIACQCGEGLKQCPIIMAILNAPERQGEIMLYDAHAFQGEPYFTLFDKSAYRMEDPALFETILDNADQAETTRLYEQFQQILAQSTLTASCPPPTMANN